MPSRIRVLHVDDDPAFVDLTATALEREREQFAVETASSADDGLDRLAGADYDCIVSDYDMPGMDGIDFLTAVRNEYQDLPFILFTGKGSEEVASDAISAGVTDYLRKGSGTDQYELLANRITNAVSQVRAERQLEAERQRFQILFDRLSQATVEVEYRADEPIVERVNPAFEETFGYDAADIVGESLDAYIVPEDRTEEAADINRRVQDGASLDSEEVTRQTADGTRRFLLQNAVYDDGTGGFAIYTDVTERKRRERELERQNTRLRALFEHFPEPTEAYAYRDGEPYVVDVNEAFTETFGYEKETAVGSHVDDLVVPPDRREEARRIDERVKAGDRIDAELRRQTADGLGDFRLRNIRLPEDEHIDGYAVYADITAYKERQRELERQNDLFRKAQDIADVGAWEYDITADELTWTAKTYEIHGISEEREITVEDAIDFYHPDDRPAIRDAVTEATETGEPYDLEARLVTAAGDQRWIRTRGDPQTADGSIVRVRGTIQDITAHKEREAELREQTRRLEELTSQFERQYRHLFEEAPVMAVVTRADDGAPVIEDCNQRFAERLGYERASLIGRDLAELYTAESKQRLLDDGGYDRALSGEFMREERTFVTADGGTVETLLRAVPRADAREETDGTLAMYIDISTRRDVERENARLEEFIDIISHDLRNPLNAAQSYRELVADDCDSEYLANVQRAHDRMETLIEDLLAYARSGQRVETTEPVALEDVANQCWDGITTDDATLAIETDRSIRANRSRVYQLVENLLRNAVEHTGPDTTITVGDLPDGFYVEDTGPGIPPETRDEVFTTGYSTSDEGTGFGLNIVEQIAEAHGWTIRVTEGTAGGARFEIRGVETAG